jgi:hypothetical protein
MDSPEVRELFDAVYTVYGQFTATKLEKMTHQELPWSKTPQNRVISLELLRGYFSTLVEAGRNSRALPGESLWPTKSVRHRRRRELSSSMAAHRERLKAIKRNSPISADW